MSTQPDRTRRPFVIEDAIAILSRTPSTLDALVRGLPDGWVAANEGGDTWSPFDVIGHLIHGERTDWIPRARIILDHNEAKPFEKFDRLAQFVESKGRTLPSLLDEFAALRRENLRALESLHRRRHGGHQGRRYGDRRAVGIQRQPAAGSFIARGA
jgi:hypothetical protein